LSHHSESRNSPGENDGVMDAVNPLLVPLSKPGGGGTPYGGLYGEV